MGAFRLDIVSTQKSAHRSVRTKYSLISCIHSDVARDTLIAPSVENEAGT